MWPCVELKTMDLMLAKAGSDVTSFCAAAGEVDGILHCSPETAPKKMRQQQSPQAKSPMEISWPQLCAWHSVVPSKSGLQRIDHKHLLLESLVQCERKSVVFFCHTISLYALSPPVCENGTSPSPGQHQLQQLQRLFKEAQDEMPFKTILYMSCKLLQHVFDKLLWEQWIVFVGRFSWHLSLFVIHLKHIWSRPEGPACSSRCAWIHHGLHPYKTDHASLPTRSQLRWWPPCLSCHSPALDLSGFVLMLVLIWMFRSSLRAKAQAGRRTPT